jgi:S1-C subfamily serine protease
VKKPAVFNIDLEGFYDQIHFGRVMGLLMAQPYLLQKETAQLIANLCCVDKKLPQGAPTSPVISNMICRTLDKQLSLFAKNNKAQYSRYADDITFSFRNLSLNKVVQVVGGEYLPSNKLTKYIEKGGFSINEKKTRYQTYEQRQTVTGLKVNQKVNVDRRYIRATKAMIFALSNGVDAVNEKYRKTNKAKPDTPLAAMVLGRLNFIGMVKGIECKVYQGLAKKFNNLELDLKATVTPHHSKREKTKLPFFQKDNVSRLEACVWVVDFDGVDGIGDDEELMQGTAFIVEGQRIFTASHVFKSAGYPKYCNLYRVTDPLKKFKARLVRQNITSDVAELKFIDTELPQFNFLSISKNEHVNAGYEVAVVGFPQYRASNKTVSIRTANIVNTFTNSTFENKEIDVDINGGNSGGPVIDGYLGVVGIAMLGMTVSDDGIEGTNAFISIKHLNDRLDEVDVVEEHAYE